MGIQPKNIFNCCQALVQGDISNMGNTVVCGHAPANVTPERCWALFEEACCNVQGEEDRMCVTKEDREAAAYGYYTFCLEPPPIQSRSLAPHPRLAGILDSVHNSKWAEKN